VSQKAMPAKAGPLEHFALGKLSTRESLLREIQKRVKAELVSETDLNRSLNGPLGEQIAIASGTFSLDFTDPEHIAEGICSWLDQTFLNQPLQGLGPREGTEDAPTPPSSEGADGSRVGTLVHLPNLIRREFGISSSEARRLIVQGGVAIDGVRLEQDELDVPAERIQGAQLRIGRRRGKRIDLQESR
jgi:hypothetical protein